MVRIRFGFGSDVYSTLQFINWFNFIHLGKLFIFNFHYIRFISKLHIVTLSSIKFLSEQFTYAQRLKPSQNVEKVHFFILVFRIFITVR